MNIAKIFKRSMSNDIATKNWISKKQKVTDERFLRNYSEKSYQTNLIIN